MFLLWAYVYLILNHMFLITVWTVMKSMLGFSYIEMSFMLKKNTL